MGTRNITNVIFDDELKVCQYGQWDGYPTGAGRDIMDFIRRSDDGRVIERLKDVEMHVCKDGDDVYYTGYPVSDELNMVMREKHDYIVSNWKHDYEDNERRAMAHITDKFGKEVVLRAMLATRDTGCDALDLIYDSEGHVDTWTSPYLLGNAGDWQIEAVWKLDYDVKVLTGIWHGEVKNWTFDEIRGWSEDEMVSVLKAYEGWDED